MPVPFIDTWTSNGPFPIAFDKDLELGGLKYGVGVVSGCAPSFSANNLRVAAGQFVNVLGELVTLDAEVSISGLGISPDGNYVLYWDTSAEQLAVAVFDTATTAGCDIEDMPFAVFQVAGGSVGNVTDCRRWAAVNTDPMTILVGQVVAPPYQANFTSLMSALRWMSAFKLTGRRRADRIALVNDLDAGADLTDWSVYAPKCQNLTIGSLTERRTIAVLSAAQLPIFNADGVGDMRWSFEHMQISYAGGGSSPSTHTRCVFNKFSGGFRCRDLYVTGLNGLNHLASFASVSDAGYVVLEKVRTYNLCVESMFYVGGAGGGVIDCRKCEFVSTTTFNYVIERGGTSVPVSLRVDDSSIENASYMCDYGTTNKAFTMMSGGEIVVSVINHQLCQFVHSAVSLINVRFEDGAGNGSVSLIGAETIVNCFDNLDGSGDVTNTIGNIAAIGSVIGSVGSALRDNVIIGTATAFALVHEANVVGTTGAVTREYVTSSGVRVVTLNCKFSGGTWSRDNAGSPAYKYSYSNDGLIVQNRTTAGSWADSAWDSTLSANKNGLDSAWALVQVNAGVVTILDGYGLTPTTPVTGSGPWQFNMNFDTPVLSDNYAVALTYEGSAFAAVRVDRNIASDNFTVFCDQNLNSGLHNFHISVKGSH